MDIAIIADKDTIIGFKLAGVRNSAVFNEKTIKEDIIKFKESHILILTENIAKTVRENKLEKLIEGVIVEVPDKNGSTGLATNEISRLFEEAIGVKLKEN
ncbi:MAG: V-type ATP synthase subunit F [Candidatus Woesearchaeota archaeon]|jgi:vacuolar-type H+-ATPase subunit F/Vma7|nr:V-type ATP synthase subunit F [Candidatus Woesearchaeota archaeon]MDP7457539.1 V-type ATP synthase subunit F [Candidatus Woesearchaeota archaeon]|tara:strand:+ start:408 stop:707 length:300 start_codon:yes stop_codon:yes gene_type:complete